MSKIKDIRAFEIIDSRGNPTIKAEVILDAGIIGGASVPSGASKGTHEAYELRDNDPDRYHGMGVLKAIEIIQTIILPKLKGLDPTNQREIDEIMINLDGTENKSKLGGNSTLSVSLACARVAAKSLGKPLYQYINVILNTFGKLSASSFQNPLKTLKQVQGDSSCQFGMTSKSVTPMFNIINGGLHGSGKFNFQEFLLIPKPGLPFNDALRMGVEIYQSLKKNLSEKNFIYSVGDEGGFTPQFTINEEVLDFLIDSINKSSYSYGKDVYLGLDFAASSFYKDNSYTLVKNGEPLDKSKYINYLVAFAQKYQLYSLEDSLYEDDWEGW
ncbi:phosphopyruvate hydratase, partial [Candidatus Gottesmanbacteria bacterium]|nr:phosphopyruvate hydratase [Candidatus Gottesmanbacteria bacterium]